MKSCFLFLFLCVFSTIFSAFLPTCVSPLKRPLRRDRKASRTLKTHPSPSARRYPRRKDITEKRICAPALARTLWTLSVSQLTR